MDSQDDVQERSRPVILKGFSEGIRFDHVGFSYSDDEGVKDVLYDIDLEVHCGEVVAIVGPSGSGKTTLVNLIPRFFDGDFRAACLSMGKMFATM